MAIETLKKNYMQAQMFFSDKDYHHAIDILTQVIDVQFINFLQSSYF